MKMWMQFNVMPRTIEFKNHNIIYITAQDDTLIYCNIAQSYKLQSAASTADFYYKTMINYINKMLWIYLC